MGTWSKHEVFKAALVILALTLMASLFLPFYAETLLGAVFAFAIEPSLGRFLRARHLRWRFSVAGILLAMFLLVAGPISLVAYRSYTFFYGISKSGFQNTELFRKLVIMRGAFVRGANEVLQSLHLQDRIDLAGLSEDALNRVGNLAVQVSTTLVYHLPSVLLSVFVFCVALYFFLAEGRTIKDAFLRLQLLTREEAEAVIKVLQRSCYNVVVTSISLGALAATMVGLGAVFFNGGDFMVVFVITFFCSFIPVIGAAPVALMLALYKFVVASYGEAIGLLCVAVLTGIVDNGVRPYLISSSEDILPPSVGLLALMGALAIFGMPGVFLGPVIASAAIRLYPILYPQRGRAAAKTTEST